MLLVSPLATVTGVPRTHAVLSHQPSSVPGLTRVVARCGTEHILRRPRLVRLPAAHINCGGCRMERT